MNENIHVHLDADQFAAGALGELDATVRAHLAGCWTCRTEMERLSNALAAAGAASLTAGERTEGFWLRQREAIAARLNDGTATQHVPRLAPRRWAWAGVAAAAGLAAVLILGRTPVPSSPRETAMDADDALLLDVARSVSRPVPRALEPGTLLLEARNDQARKAATNNPSP